MSKITVEYIDHMGNDLTVANSARVSYGKFKDKFEPEDSKLIDYLAKHKHLTPFEHCQLTVRIKCPLYIRSQIHRHRSFSYNEISRRYTSENLEFYVPETFRSQHKSSKQCSGEALDDMTQTVSKVQMEELHKKALQVYEGMIILGVAREQARAVLPQSLITEFWMSGDLRNWIHFLGLRLDNHAQQEVQDVAKPILDIIQQYYPESAKALFKYSLNIT